MKYPSAKMKKEKITKVTPGEYVSVVEKIEDAPGYNDGDGIVIFYVLEKNGKKYPYKETFATSLEHERTAAFNDYIKEVGASIDNLAPLVGAKEKLVLKKYDFGSAGIFTNIAERSFIFEDGDLDATK